MVICGYGRNGKQAAQELMDHNVPILVIENDQEIVQTIVTLGQKLGMKLVAEGIETEIQVTLLRELGCELGQGYFFARPVGSDEATAILAASEGENS